MKKALLVLGLVAFIGAGFTSCKKDCKCKLYYNGEYISGLDVTTTKVKKKDCKDYTYSMYGESASYKCEWGK